MSTRSPPVPSKNALRALRSLALSYPLALTGALGSVCGIATLNYEARRRIRLAERVVANKKIIRSVSNGHGRAHVVRMCEAAERGEEFGLDVNRSNKRRRIRHHSMLAIDQWTGNEDDLPSLQASLQKLSRRPRSQSLDTQRTSHGDSPVAEIELSINTAATSPHQRHDSTTVPLEYRPELRHMHNKYSSYSKPLIAVETLPARSLSLTSGRNSSSAQKVLTASQMPLKKCSDGVYARQSRHYVTRSPLRESSATSRRSVPVRAVTSVESSELSSNHTIIPIPASGQYGRKAEATKAANRDAVRIEKFMTDDVVRVAELRVPILQSTGVASDPNPPESLPAPERGSDTRIAWPTEGENHGAFSQRLSASSTSQQLDGDSLDVADLMEDIPPNQGQMGVEDETDLQHYSSDTYRPADVSFDHESITPPASEDLSENLVEPIRISYDPAIMKETRRNEKALLDAARHQIMIFTKKERRYQEEDFIKAHQTIRSLVAQIDLRALTEYVRTISKHGGAALVLDEIGRCMDQSTPSSLAQAEFLFYAFYREFGLGMDSLPCRRLAAHLLSDNACIARASYMLFPLRSDRTRTDDYEPANQLKYRPVQKYLTWFCQMSDDIDGWIAETKKCVAAAKSRGIPLHNRLLSPVLWALVHAGEVHRAQALVEQLKREWNMQVTFMGFGILVRGYAFDGEWSAVQDIIEQLHTEGFSRTRPVGFSMLFHEAFEEYLTQKPLNQAYDYLIHATAHWGLIPTSTISTTILTACLRQERYDLIQEWVEAVRQLYPRVAIGTRTTMAAWKVAQVWREKNASCEEIEKGCQAMAYSSLSEPFSTAMRGVAMEAVERDLRKRLLLAKNLWGYRSLSIAEACLAKMTFSDMVRLVREFVAKNPDSEALPLIQQQHLQDILRQIVASTSLNGVFAGEVSKRKMRAHDSSWNTQMSSRLTRSPEELEAVEGVDLPDGIVSGRLPSWSKLRSLVLGYYVKREADGKPTSHIILEHLMPRMIQQRRLDDAVQILSSVYESPFTRGSGGLSFTRALYSAWIHIALELKNGREIAKALWAAVDSEIAMTTEFLLLVRIATTSSMSNRHLSALEWREVGREAHYLEKKLQKRHWIQAGMREKEGRALLAGFERWEERLRAGTVMY